MNFLIFISFLAILRIGELFLSAINEKWLRANGAIEYGQKHYPYLILLHICFIFSLIIEYSYRTTATTDYFFLILFLTLTAVKIQVIHSLGKYWSTKIFHIQGVPLIKKGLYKYFKHPNYIIVICEVVVIPLIFHLYITAIVFSLLNGIMLSIRINEENKAIS